jgi:hypothetical protein
MAKDLQSRIKEIELSIEKTNATATSKAWPCLSSACCSVCFSSLSSVRNKISEAYTHDPEIAQMMVSLYDKSVQVQGEAKTLQAMKTLSDGFAADDLMAELQKEPKSK